MQKVSYACESFKQVLSDDDTFKEAFSKVHELSSEIIGEIDRIEPCEADSVELVRSMHTIEMRNDSRSESIENIRIIFEKAEYIEYQKKGEERKEIRGQRQKIVTLGDLSTEGIIEMNAWATCKVSMKPKFTLMLGRGSQNIYVRIPVGKLAAFVNKHPGAIRVWALLFVCLICISACWLFIKFVYPATSRHRGTFPITPIQEQKNEQREMTSGNNSE